MEQQTEQKPEVITGNQLIAKFMGCLDERGCFKSEAIETWLPESLKYHNSWDWLMPACKKWVSLRYDPLLAHYRERHEDRITELKESLEPFEIEPVFEQLVKNIEWYNSITQSRV